MSAGSRAVLGGRRPCAARRLSVRRLRRRGRAARPVRHPGEGSPAPPARGRTRRTGSAAARGRSAEARRPRLRCPRARPSRSCSNQRRAPEATGPRNPGACSPSAPRTARGTGRWIGRCRAGSRRMPLGGPWAGRCSAPGWPEPAAVRQGLRGLGCPVCLRSKGGAARVLRPRRSSSDGMPPEPGSHGGTSSAQVKPRLRTPPTRLGGSGSAGGPPGTVV